MMKSRKSTLAWVYMGKKPGFNNTSHVMRQEFRFTRSEILKFFTLWHSMFKKSTAFTFGCIDNNELNGPGSGFTIRVFRGWHPQPIHGQPDAVLYGASSQNLVLFASFFKVLIKRNMVLVEINKKINFMENTRMEPGACGLLFWWSLGSFLIVNCQLLIVNPEFSIFPLFPRQNY